MGSASRGDVGGADELRQTLGLVSKAADSFQEYTNTKFQRDEAVNAGRGAADQATGHVDETRAAESRAYRTAVELGRERTKFPAALIAYGERLTGLIEQQTSADPHERRREVDEDIRQFVTSYAIDPETGELRDDLKSPEAQRWLADAIDKNTHELSAAGYARIKERMNNEALAQVGLAAGSQLDAGQLDVAELRRMLPPGVPDDQLRGTLLSTLQGKSEEFKANGRWADAIRIVDQALGFGSEPGAIRLVDIPASTPVPFGDAPAPAPAAAAVRTPSTARRRSRDDVISFVLNDLEGGAKVVNNRDGGGTTKFGITQRYNPDVDVANLSFAQAKSIARDRYWQSAYDSANPAVAAIAFDAGYINSKSFAREIATKYANDPAGALAAYRGRLQSIAQKPDKARFLRPWMNRLDRLASYLGIGSSGGAAGDQSSINVADDPAFALDPEPLDPVETVRRSPGVSFASQLTGSLAFRAEERSRLLEYRDQLSREAKAEWQRERAKVQEGNGHDFLLRLSGLGPSVTPTEIAESARRRDISPQQTATLLNVIRQDADRAEARAERAANQAERDRDKADEQQAQGIVANLMGPVYSGQRSPAEALRLFSAQAAGIDPKVRRAVLGAVTSEASGVEAVRRNNPAFTSAVEVLDDGEAEMLRLVRGPYRDPQTGRQTSVEQQRAIISLEVAKAKRELMRAAVDRGADTVAIGNLRTELIGGIKSRVRRYLTTRPARRAN